MNDTYLGLDVSKNTLDLAGPGMKHLKVPNNAEGLAKLITVLLSLSKPAHVVLEATGGYERLAIITLQASQIKVSRVNPYQVRCFAKGMGKQAKTDHIDALVLAEFGQQRKPRPLAPYDESLENLRALYDRRQQLVAARVCDSNRLETASKAIHKQLKETLRFFDKQIAVIELLLKKQIAAHPEMQKKVQLLQKVKGVGPLTATMLLIYMPELGFINGKEAAALAGVAPYNKDSGRYQGYRSTRAGRYEVKRVLYMAALSAARSNRILKAFYEHLLTKGKSKKTALVAIMRKLIVLFNEMLKNPNFSLVS